MPRPKNAIPTKKVTPTITMAVHDRLVRLAKIGIYGNSPAEVARHLIVSGLDDLSKTGVLPNDHQTTGCIRYPARRGHAGVVAADRARPDHDRAPRSEEHTSELQSLMRISSAV